MKILLNGFRYFFLLKFLVKTMCHTSTFLFEKMNLNLIWRIQDGRHHFKIHSRMVFYTVTNCNRSGHLVSLSKTFPEKKKAIEIKNSTNIFHLKLKKKFNDKIISLNGKNNGKFIILYTLHWTTLHVKKDITDNMQVNQWQYLLVR